MGQQVADVLVQKPERTHADSNKQQRLAELEGRDQYEPAIVARLRKGVRGGIGHDAGGTCACSYVKRCGAVLLFLPPGVFIPNRAPPAPKRELFGIGMRKVLHMPGFVPA